MAYNSDNMGIVANAVESIHAYTTTEAVSTVIAGDVLLRSFDFHYQSDTLGSRQEYIK